jgi:hypothetical protein
MGTLWAALLSPLMSIGDVALNVAVSLLSGTAGAVIFASPISQRTERGRRRHEAETTTRGVLSTYRSVLAYHRAQIDMKQSYPAGYASLRSQEQLAEDVLRELPYLSRRRRRLLRGLLERLVGRLTISMAEGRVFVPKQERDEENESARLGLFLAEVLQSQDVEGMGYGELGEVQRAQHLAEHFDRAIGTLDDMIESVPVQRELGTAIPRFRRNRVIEAALKKRAAELEKGPDA